MLQISASVVSDGLLEVGDRTCLSCWGCPWSTPRGGREGRLDGWPDPASNGGHSLFRRWTSPVPGTAITRCEKGGPSSATVMVHECNTLGVDLAIAARLRACSVAIRFFPCRHEGAMPYERRSGMRWREVRARYDYRRRRFAHGSV